MNTYKLFTAMLAFFMLGYVVMVFLTFRKTLPEIAVGLVAGLMIAVCALAIHVYQKKGEVR